jgi:hypothetical protein
MKKAIFLSIAGALVVFTAANYISYSHDQMAAVAALNNSAASGSSLDIHIANDETVSITGATISTIGTSSITVTAARGMYLSPWTVNIVPRTMMTQKDNSKSSLAEFSVGDYVSINGTLDTSKSVPTIGATKIKDYSIKTLVTQLSGSVLSINASSSSFLMATAKNGNVNVVISAQTFLGQGQYNINNVFSSIKLGEKATVGGVMNTLTNSVKATKIIFENDSGEAWSGKEISIKTDTSDIQTFINKPKGTTFDLLLIFHGTTESSDNNTKAALDLSNQLGKKIIADRPGLMTASVVYDANEILRGGKIPIDTAEKALEWFQNGQASNELGIKINKIYLLGHSQGGYVVIKLNSLYKTDGVIANGPGPIDLTWHCKKAQSGPSLANDEVCNVMQKLYGDAKTNPAPYDERSLVFGLGPMKAPLLILQGLDDKKGQLELIPELMAKLKSYENGPSIQLVEIPNVGHYTFTDRTSWSALTKFLK